MTMSARGRGPRATRASPLEGEQDMRKIVFPRTRLDSALSLLLSGGRFEVLAQANSKEATFAALVLGRFGWSWGHFYRSAFCSLMGGEADEVTLAISYLDVQRQW